MPLLIGRLIVFTLGGGSAINEKTLRTKQWCLRTDSGHHRDLTAWSPRPPAWFFQPTARWGGAAEPKLLGRIEWIKLDQYRRRQRDARWQALRHTISEMCVSPPPPVDRIYNYSGVAEWNWEHHFTQITWVTVISLDAEYSLFLLLWNPSNTDSYYFEMRVIRIIYSSNPLVHPWTGWGWPYFRESFFEICDRVAKVRNFFKSCGTSNESRESRKRRHFLGART